MISIHNLNDRHLNDISYTSFTPLRDSSLLIFNAASAAKLKK